MYRFHVFAYCLLLSLYARTAGGQDKQNGGLPAWLQTGLELRGRMEGHSGLDFVPNREDLFYFHRIRAHAIIKPLPWMKFFVMAQHALAPAEMSSIRNGDTCYVLNLQAPGVFPLNRTIL